MPSYGDEETSAAAGAADGGFCGWGGMLVGNGASKNGTRWANGHSSAGREGKQVVEAAGGGADEVTEYRHNNNNCSSSTNPDDVRETYTAAVQQQRQRQSGISGLRSSNRRYSLLRCILCNLKQGKQGQPQQQQQQKAARQQTAEAEEEEGGQLYAQIQRTQPSEQSQSRPQAIVVAVVVGASIDHQIQQQEPQLTGHQPGGKQHRNVASTSGGGGAGGGCAGDGLRVRNRCFDDYRGDSVHVGANEALL